MNARILVVDDDETIRDLLLHHLERDYLVRTASTLAEARVLLDDDPPDIMILDWRLPDGLGGELLREFEQRRYRPITAVLTHRHNISSEMQSVVKWIDDYFPKPFQVDEIGDRIRHLLRANSALRKIRELERRIGARGIRTLGVEIMRQAKDGVLAGVEFGRVGSFECSGLLEEAYRLGGDILEELTFAGGKKGFLIGDICGKGMAASTVSATLRAAVLYLSRRSHGPAELLSEVAARWQEWFPPRYLASALAVMVEGDRITWASAGHPWPRARIEGIWKTLGVSGELFGFSSEPEYVEHEIDMKEGDCFCAFSDGAVEIRDTENQMLHEEGLYEVLSYHLSSAPPHVAVRKVHATLRAFHAGRPADDDLALLIFQHRPGEDFTSE